MKILIVDDNPELLEMLDSVLVHSGHTVIVANDGDEAFRAYCDNPGIELTITDKDMPGRNGLELIQGIKTIRNTARIWLITGDIANFDKIRAGALEFGAEKVILKGGSGELFDELKRHGLIK